MNMVELFVLARKISTSKTNTLSNEYLRYKIYQAIREVSSQAFNKPYVIKIFIDNTMHNITLMDVSLKRVDYQYLTFLKSRLRSVITEVTFDGVKRTDTDVSAAELLFAYKLNCKMLYDEERDMIKKISAIKEGRDLSRINLEVLYRMLKTYELEMLQRKLLKAHHGHVVDGSSALIMNDREKSEDEQDDQVPVIQAMEQKNK
ncbi:hypothetical protein AgCh_012087 [Apium graveolens]